VPSFQDEIDPEIRPMSQDSLSLGFEHQLNRDSVLTVHYIHNDLRDTIEDIGFLNAQGDEGYLIGNPGRGSTAVQFASGATPAGQPTPLAERQYDALELGVSRRLANSWFLSANYTLSRLYGNYSGIGSSDEITTPATGQTSATAQQQLGSITTYAMSTNSTGGIGSMVEGRGDLGRTPVLTRTDLLLSHELGVAGGKRLRFEMNVLNLFNQRTARHIYNGLNRGLGAGGARQSAAIDLSGTDLTRGYDYNALILGTTEGAGAYDPRYGKDDLFDDGTRGYFTVKFLF